MLMKLTPGVNFANILGAAVSFKSFLQSFSQHILWLYNFWHNNIGAKSCL